MYDTVAYIHSFTCYILQSIDKNERIHPVCKFTGCTSTAVSEKVSTLCEEARLEEALQVVEQRRIGLSRNNGYLLLQKCSEARNGESGRRVQFLLVQNKLEAVSVLGDYLIRLFGNCGSLFETNQAFKTVLMPSQHTWSSIIWAHANLGQGNSALELYHRTRVGSLKGSKYVYIAGLKGCVVASHLAYGRLIHNNIIESGIHVDVVVGNTLVDFYVKCGTLEEALEVFRKMVILDVVSWSVVISGYAEHGETFLAIDCFDKMQEEGIKPDEITYSGILKACHNVQHGRIIHEQIWRNNISMNVVGSSIINMYFNCSSLQEAIQVFDNLLNPDILSWGTIIAGLVKHDEDHLALVCYKEMQKEGIKTNDPIFLTILQACGKLGAIEQGRILHERTIIGCHESDNLVGNALINMYMKCGSIDEAHYVLDNLTNWDVVSWNTAIAGYADHGMGQLALKHFEKMQQVGIKPNQVTFLHILKACQGEQVLEQGRVVHDQIIEAGFQSDSVGNALVYLYGKFGSMEEAHKLFNDLPSRDVVSWNALIAGCIYNDRNKLVLEYYETMQRERIIPDTTTTLYTLRACSNIGAIENGRLVHRHIVKQFNILQFTLIHMYAKCGSMEEAKIVFSQLPSQHAVSWSAMIAGYGQHGDVRLAIQYLGDMESSGVTPDRVTFIGILIACTRVGLVDEGHWYFRYMEEIHAVKPDEMHINCMIDLLGHVGCFDEAAVLLQCSAPYNNSDGWMALLNACRIYGNMELVRQCFVKSQVLCDPGL